MKKHKEMADECEWRTRQKGKRKKDLEGRHVMVRKNKSFVESKRIFWKQGTDAKSLFS